MKLSTLLIAAALSMAAGSTLAQEPVVLDARLDALARAWAHVNYETPDRHAQAAQAQNLAAEADALVKQNPNRAEPLVWEAISLATEAGAKGGLDGLSLAKQARQLLERAERLNPAALGDGSVYTSLGSLYAQVPGFPIGFGDPVKARAYLRKALAANPRGVDPNYFYGDFLFRQGDYAGAVHALEQAVAAPTRPGRDTADRGRRNQASALLAQARQKLHG